MDYLSSRPRAAQLLGKDSDVVVTLEHALTRHLKDVRRHAFKPDKRSVAHYVLSTFRTVIVMVLEASTAELLQKWTNTWCTCVCILLEPRWVACGIRTGIRPKLLIHSPPKTFYWCVNRGHQDGVMYQVKTLLSKSSVSLYAFHLLVIFFP